MTEKDQNVTVIDPWLTAVPGLLPPGPPLVTQQLALAGARVVPDLRSVLSLMKFSADELRVVKEAAVISARGAIARVNEFRDFEGKPLLPSQEILQRIRNIFDECAALQRAGAGEGTADVASPHAYMQRLSLVPRPPQVPM